MPRHTWMALLTIAGLALACEQPAEETGEMAEPAVDVAAEEQAIRDFADQYEQAYNSGNADAVLALYTSESSEIAADGTAEPHDTSVRATMSENPGSTIAIDHERTVVASSGDLAYDMGTYTITVMGADGQPMPLTMRYLVGLKKVDGAWKLDVTMSSNPIGGTTPGPDTTAAPTGP